MNSTKLTYLLVALPVAFMVVYYLEVVEYVRNLDPTIHPEYEVRCGEANQKQRDSEVIQYEGQLYCCRTSAVECSTSISDGYIDETNGTSTCFIEQDFFVTNLYNTSDVYEPTYVDGGIEEINNLWLYLGVASIGLIGIISFLTNRQNFVRKTLNIATFLSELVVGTILLHWESASIIKSGPYEAYGNTFGGSAASQLSKWKGFLLVFSITSEWLCDAMILSASTKLHLEGVYDKKTLEADGWSDYSTVGARLMLFFVVVQCGAGGAYMISEVFGCSDFTPSGGQGLALAALIISCIGCCCCISMALCAECRESFIFGSEGRGRKFSRLVVSLFITEIPGLMLNPLLDGIGALFLTLIGYSTFETALDIFSDCEDCADGDILDLGHDDESNGVEEAIDIDDETGFTRGENVRDSKDIDEGDGVTDEEGPS